MNFYTTSQLGPSRHLLKNGSLVCKNVPIARVGRLLYKDHEIDIKGDRQGIVRIDRDPEEVFSPQSIDSFNGAAVTVDHPPEAVTPRNWAAYAKGTVTNARRGTGSQSDLLIADLLITDAETIRQLMDGSPNQRNPQVSSGYDCDYEEIGPALGRQVGIVGNHVAFVAAGRAGPRCSVGDSAMARRPLKIMTTADRLRKAFKDGDQEALDLILARNFEEEDDDSTSHHTHVHLPQPVKERAITVDKETMDVQTILQTHDTRMTGIEGTLASITTDIKTISDKLTADAALVKDEKTVKKDDDGKDGDKEELANKKKTTDAATVIPDVDQAKELTGVFAVTLSRGEILAPGTKLMTFDSAATLQSSLDALHAFRVKALTAAIANDETGEIIKPIIPNGVDLSTLTQDAASLLFTTSAELVRSHRNAASKSQPAPSGVLTYGANNPASPAELNKKYAEFSAKHYAH
jgi:uncharacterized protein